MKTQEFKEKYLCKAVEEVVDELVGLIETDINLCDYFTMMYGNEMKECTEFAVIRCICEHYNYTEFFADEIMEKREAE